MENEVSCTHQMQGKVVRIGCGSGFWGDSAAGPRQLVQAGVDVLALDYLSEITMSLLARARKKRPELGYTPDFVSSVMAPLAAEISARRIKVVANAGGVNPEGCRDALRAALDRRGVRLSIAVVSGDDVSSELGYLRDAGHPDLETQRPLPRSVISANAYLGAFPIAAALRNGADVVITGRCVDSALVLGPLIAAFDWRACDLDQLAMGSLAGHIVECGVQATGGIFTDWRDVASGWDNMGFPIVECRSDGSFVVTKPEGTGGRVSPATVAEQITYEVHDPSRYLLPDVTCNFSDVRLEQVGADRVLVTGARGLPAPEDYKASLTYHDGYRCMATMLIAGREAVAKATCVGEAILARTRRMLLEAGFADYSRTSIEVLGGESLYGTHSRALQSREVILKIATTHTEEAALQLFAREIYPAATSMAQGITGFAGGRPEVQPVVRLASCLIPKSRVRMEIDVDGVPEELPSAENKDGDPLYEKPRSLSFETLEGPFVTVPLIRLAHGRSGDKGDRVNIGIIARRPEYLSAIAAALTPDAVRDYLNHLVHGEIERFDWPGIHAFNLVLHGALDGGGTASLRYDPQGKSYAQILMDMPVPVPVSWLENFEVTG
jgi:hypothetical protein